MAIIVAEFSIPFVCWMAPEMPRAMYRSGFTWTPVTPTCRSLSHQPRSVTALVAPTAPPRASASSSTRCQFSGPPSPLPPDTTTFEFKSLSRSGLMSVFSKLINFVLTSSVPRPASSFIISTSLAWSRGASTKEPLPIVAIIVSDKILTSQNNFPSKEGLIHLMSSLSSVSSTDEQSATSPTFLFAETLPAKSRPLWLAGSMTIAGSYLSIRASKTFA